MKVCFLDLICWFQGGLTATDVFAVQWIHTGAIHFGMTVSYFGFVSDGKIFYVKDQDVARLFIPIVPLL